MSSLRNVIAFAWFACCVTLAIGVGCSRKWHRQDADQDAARLVGEKGGTPAERLVYADPYSRLADPNSVDCPPMPPDDPLSHNLMHCVDGKKGFDGWHRFGSAGQVESPYWQQSLIRSPNGEIVVDLREAVRLARLHSRDYQENIETLYLSALDVSFERFQFDHQLFAGATAFGDIRGRNDGRRSEYDVGTFAETRKLTATGGEIVIGFANSLLWDVWGNDTDVFSSAIDFSLVQPLLRFGGRARVLENLTQQERNLLANVRQLQQFQQGFFVNVITGRGNGPGPSLGNNIGSAGLGLIAGIPSGRSGAPRAGGYLGLLENQQEIRNQVANIAALRDSLAQLEAAFDANRISSRLQVDQARQALLNAQSSLLTDTAAYETRLDAFKIRLGLPAELPLKIEDPLLDRFVLIDPNLTKIQDQVESILSTLRRMRDEPTQDALEQTDNRLQLLAPAIKTQLDLARAELERLDGILPDRRDQLRRVREKIEAFELDVDPRVYDIESMERRFATLHQQLPEIETGMVNLLDAVSMPLAERQAQLKIDASLAGPESDDISDEFEELQPPANEAVEGDEATDPAQAYWETSLEIATRLSDRLLELSLVQAEVRLQGISLNPTQIDATQALEFARINRLDWMNARANLVDVWRKIEFRANELKSDLNILVEGTYGTKPSNNRSFSEETGRLRFGVRFDTPTARLAERNRYRVALLDYQQARRDYIVFEDRISQSLRNTIRTLRLSEINLEVRRAAVQVAIAQVDIARLKLNPPVRPNQPSRTSPTAARDLVSALTDLLDAQNDFLNVWVANEVLRILLDFEMGTMQLDPTGVWVDSGVSGQVESVLPPPAEADLTDFLRNRENQFEIITLTSDSLPPAE